MEVDRELVERIKDALAHPMQFGDLLRTTRDKPYRAFLVAWSEIRSQFPLERDELGRYWRSTER